MILFVALSHGNSQCGHCFTSELITSKTEINFLHSTRISLSWILRHCCLHLVEMGRDGTGRTYWNLFHLEELQVEACREMRLVNRKTSYCFSSKASTSPLSLVWALGPLRACLGFWQEFFSSTFPSTSCIRKGSGITSKEAKTGLLGAKISLSL